MTEHSIAHGSFTVERTYAHPPAKVFAAWSNPEHKRQWFGSPAGKPGQIFEFKVGGREYNADRMVNSDFTFNVLYQDIVPDNRIVYTYEMTIDGKRMSVSLATIELFPTETGTRMVVREDGAFLDGLDTSKQREEGTNYLVDQIGVFLDK